MHRVARVSFTVAVIVVSCGFLSQAAETAVARVERGNLVLEDIPETPGRILDLLQPYQNIRNAVLRGWHPSGRGVVMTTRFADTDQVHLVAEPGGVRRQLTFFGEPVSSVAVSPNPSVNGLLFAKDLGGGEDYQLFFFEIARGQWRMMTDGTSRNGSPVWARDGKRFAFYTTRRNGTDWDIHLADVERPGASRAVLEMDGKWQPVEFSPDGTTLLVVRNVSANEDHPHLLDLASGRLTPLYAVDQPTSHSGLSFARDGKGIYYASDEGSEFKRLRYLDLASRRVDVLTGDIPWDVEDVELSDDGRHLAFTVNEDGFSRLYLWSLPERTELAVPELPDGRLSNLHFSPDGSELGMVVESPRSPGDVYSLDWERGTMVRWTESEVGGLPSDTFARAELIRYPTFDEVDGAPRMIPGLLYLPRGGGPHPVMIDIHGGPEGQARPTFSAFTQYLVGVLGIAVIRPNVRGSTGYGKTYLGLDNGYDREDTVRDIGALIDWIQTRADFDRNRVGVIGGSYGGYMVLASMVHHGDRLRAGVERVGISNFVTFLTNTRDYRRDLRRVEYGDERDPEMRAFLDRISPANHADGITKPLLIAQGLNDPRVPVTESEQMVREIRNSGGTVWYLLANDEGHGFRKKQNRDVYEAVAAHFLERYLLGE